MSHAKYRQYPTKAIALGLAGLLAVASSIIVPQPANALSCLAAPFLFNASTQAVIFGEVLRVEEDGSLTIKAIDAFSGIVTKEEIRIDSRSFAYWREMSSFSEGSKWVFKLDSTAQVNYDFELSPCLNPLEVSESTVTGWITDVYRNETITLDELKQLVESSIVEE